MSVWQTRLVCTSLRCVTPEIAFAEVGEVAADFWQYRQLSGTEQKDSVVNRLSENLHGATLLDSLEFILAGSSGSFFAKEFSLRNLLVSHDTDTPIYVFSLALALSAIINERKWIPKKLEKGKTTCQWLCVKT